MLVECLKGRLFLFYCIILLSTSLSSYSKVLKLKKNIYSCPKVSEGKTADQSADPNSDLPRVDASDTLGHGNEESRTEGLTQSCPELGSSSDSYTLLTPSLDGPPVSLLSTETLGGAEFSQAEEELPQEETLHLQSKEKPHQEGKQSGE